MGPVRLAFVVTLPAVRPDAVPVIFVPTNAVGVPSAGVTRVGDVANTTTPEPVVDAALMAVPLPDKIPVTLVVRVIAGVVVAVATVPANPLAVTTDTLVTVPAPLPVAVRTPAVRSNPVPTVTLANSPVLSNPASVLGVSSAMEIVPAAVIGPPVKPVPVLIWVTEPAPSASALELL